MNYFFTLKCLALFVLVSIAHAETPKIMLAHKYHSDIVTSDYFASEKLDGIRARWTGSELMSRGGKRFAAPEWFIKEFPSIPMDGELWSKRGEYQKISSITSRKEPHEGWRELRFMVFDLPAMNAMFSERVEVMRQLPKTPFLATIPQRTYADSKGLMNQFEDVIANGGEGLILHHKDASYTNGRSNNLLKLKQYEDAEATVVGYSPGKGKYHGLTGALRVRHNGKTFLLGSGLSDVDRVTPPPIGSVVTYRYQGFTDAGIPRFAVFLRVRAFFNAEVPK